MNPFIKLTCTSGDVFILRSAIVAIANVKGHESVRSHIWVNGQDDPFNILESQKEVMDILCPTPSDTSCHTPDKRLVKSIDSKTCLNCYKLGSKYCHVFITEHGAIEAGRDGLRCSEWMKFKIG